MANKAKATDFTGKERERLLEQTAKERAERANQISTAIQVEQQISASTATDVVTGQTVDVETVATIEVNDPEDKRVKMRVSEDTTTTFGAGNHYEFKAGENYVVPVALYRHLDEKGRVWH